MANEITLAVGASAEPNTCGSCIFFRRTMDMGEYNMSSGICGFRLPRQMHILFAPKIYKDGDEDRLRLGDTERCDLYQHDGRVYIVQRRIPPLRNG